MAHMTRIDIAM
jgi:hypothetical protein